MLGAQNGKAFTRPAEAAGCLTPRPPREQAVAGG